MYASFVNLLDSKAILLKQKHIFDKAPLEKGYKDYGVFPQHALLQMGRHLNDIEAVFQAGSISNLPKEERKQMLLEAACQ